MAASPTQSEDDWRERLEPAVAVTGEDRFVPGREIGRGGMGRVVEATDEQFRRTVAVKELIAPPGGTSHARFVREAMIAGNLEHPGIAPVYARGERPDGRPWFAMRYVRGRTLAEALDAARDRDERLALLPAVIAAAHALGYAHSRGVIHRDVKPDNVLLGDHGDTVLLDWGLGKVRDALTDDPTDENAPASPLETRHGIVMGTPAYMAPEQARGDVAACDERTDVFALGAILYHLLSGHPPYVAPTVDATLTLAVDARPPALAADAPAGLAEVCTRAMSRVSADRYPDARAVAAAMEGVLARALTPEPPALVRRVGIGAGAFGLSVVTIAIALGVGTSGAAFSSQGIAPKMLILLSAVGIALDAIDVRTAGRWSLHLLSGAYVVATFTINLGLSITGVLATLDAAAASGTEAGMVVVYGLREALPPLALGSFLTAVQALVWGWARWWRSLR